MTRTGVTARRPTRSSTRVECQVVREKDFRLVADRIVDLSATGVRVMPADPVLTGERVILSFRGSRGRWVDAEATVARVLHGRRRGEHTRGLGLSFDNLDVESRAALDAELSACVPVPPAGRRERRFRPR
jgi:hypothetical protein